MEKIVFPCSICIVQSMCREECDNLVKFVRLLIRDNSYITPTWVAKNLRAGRYILDRNYTIRRETDGVPMFNVHSKSNVSNNNDTEWKWNDEPL